MTDAGKWAGSLAERDLRAALSAAPTDTDKETP